MTTIELAERLARRLRTGSLVGLSMAEAMDIVEAINAGVQEAYQLLPQWKRRTTVAIDLAAPVTRSITATNGSSTVGGDGFLEAQIGRSVVVAGDANWNEVQSTTKLLDSYLGTTGTKSAIIYGDSFYSDFLTFEGLLSAPRFADSRAVLTPRNPRLEGLAAEIGTPRYYWFEPSSAALGTSPTVYFRVHPAPDVAYALRCDMEFRPVRITYSTLNSASTIPLDQQLLDRALIPLCETRLLRSPAWSEPKLKDLVLFDAEAARTFLRDQRSTPVVPSNRVGTPAGF